MLYLYQVLTLWLWKTCSHVFQKFLEVHGAELGSIPIAYDGASTFYTAKPLPIGEEKTFEVTCADYSDESKEHLNQISTCAIGGVSTVY